MRLLAVLVVVGLACGGAQRKDPPNRPTPFCVSVLLDWRKMDIVGELCAEYWQACLDARATAIKYGKLVGVNQVGNCYHVP